jgi:hypothetical protein
MKFLLRLFISLCVFLLAGNGQLSAHTHNKDTNESIIRSLEKVGKASLEVTDNSETTFMRSSHYFEPDNSKLRATDNEGEEEELNHPSKKSLQGSGYFFAAFFQNLWACFYDTGKKGLSVTEHFFHFASNRRYIAFRVIRI